MEKETWKPVVGYEGLYEVSDWGRVKSVGRGKERILKLTPNTLGYLQVSLHKNGEQKTCKVHQLVMRAFVGECPDGYEVDHYDWDRKNNRLNNLRYIPAKENAGRKSPEWQRKTAKAVIKANSKPVNQYALDGEFVTTWASAADAERELGINHSHISECCNGKLKKTGGFVWRYAQ